MPTPEEHVASLLAQAVVMHARLLTENAQLKAALKAAHDQLDAPSPMSPVTPFHPSVVSTSGIVSTAQRAVSE